MLRRLFHLSGSGSAVGGVGVPAAGWRIPMGALVQESPTGADERMFRLGEVQVLSAGDGPGGSLTLHVSTWVRSASECSAAPGSPMTPPSL